MNAIDAADADAVIDPETRRMVNDLSAYGEGGLPVVRSREHLAELLMEGMKGPFVEMTDADWDEMEREVFEEEASE